MTDLEEVPNDHTCCWHSDGTTLTSWPPQYPEVCCHCGARRVRRPEPPPIPEGHGPHYPQPTHSGTWTGTQYDYRYRLTCGCNPALGGSGVCHCVLGSSYKIT